MNAGGIQGVISIRNTHKSGALLVGFRSKLCYLEELLTFREAAVCLSVIHNIFGNGLGDTGNVFKEGCGCRIQIHTYFVYTVLHHTA